MRQLSLSLAAVGALLFFGTQVPAAEPLSDQAAPVKAAVYTTTSNAPTDVQQVRWGYRWGGHYPYRSYHWGYRPYYSYSPYYSYYPHRSYYWGGYHPYRSYYWGRPGWRGHW